MPVSTHTLQFQERERRIQDENKALKQVTKKLTKIIKYLSTLNQGKCYISITIKTN